MQSRLSLNVSALIILRDLRIADIKATIKNGIFIQYV